MQKTVLIVDDDKFLIRVMEMALRKADYKVVCAGQGKQAIEVLSEEDMEVDMIVLDLMMPEMDGLDFLHWLRQEAKLKIPTLVQTGMVKPDTEQRVMEAGANGLVFKPIKLPDFISKVQELEKLL